MSIFHRHIFEDISTDYIPPRDEFEVSRGGGYELVKLIDKWTSGYTIIHQRCACGKYREQEIKGRLGGV